MENITTKLKTRFSQNGNIKPAAIGKKILYFIFKTKRRSVFVILFIVVLVVGGYYFLNKPTPEERAKQELASAIARVSKIMILPQDDQPVLATVTDAKTLIAQQTFFAGSINGDQLLLFPKSMKAVIWSPSRSKIINVGPIEQSSNGQQLPKANSAPQANAVADAATTITVEVRNGTGKSNYAAQAAEQISANAGYNIIKTGDAANKNYKQTIVFDRSKNVSNKSKVDAVVSAFNAMRVSELPFGEKNTNADILIILGQ